MKRIPVLLAALALLSHLPSVRADDVAVEVLWQACPYLLGTAASVALKRLTLPPDDIEAVAEVTCQVAQAYQALDASLPPVPPDDPRSVEEIFCEGSYLDACAGVAGAAPMSPAMRCAINGMKLEECAVATIEAEAAGGSPAQPPPRPTTTAYAGAPVWLRPGKPHASQPQGKQTNIPHPLIPAHGGIRLSLRGRWRLKKLDSRVRGNERRAGSRSIVWSFMALAAVAPTPDMAPDKHLPLRMAG